MRRLARLTLMWLLVVALPLQGAAAASMLGCGAGLASTGDRAVGEWLLDEGDGATTGSTSQSEVPDIAEACPHALDDTAAERHGGEAHAKARRCPVCAAFGLGVGLPAPGVRSVGARSASSYLPLAARIVPPFLTPGIERPPRSVFA